MMSSIQISKFKFCQYQLKAVLPNLPAIQYLCDHTINASKNIQEFRKLLRVQVPQAIVAYLDRQACF